MWPDAATALASRRRSGSPPNPRKGRPSRAGTRCSSERQRRSRRARPTHQCCRIVTAVRQSQIGADAGCHSARCATADCVSNLPRIEPRASASVTSRPRQSRPTGPLFDQPSSTRLSDFVLAVSRASRRVASWRTRRGALRWPGRLRSCSRRGLACSSGFQHRGRSAG